MAPIPLSSLTGAIVTDASFAIAICAKETGTEQIALAELRRYTALAYEFFAPGVLVSETLYVLCGKAADGTLKPTDHAQAVLDLETFLASISSPPHGDATLVERAEAIRGGYSCRRSADGFYIALAEQLTQTRPTTLLTFDKELPKQAARHAPSVTVKVL